MQKILLVLVMLLLGLQAQAQVAAIDIVKGEGEVLGLRLGYRPSEWYLSHIPVVGDAHLYGSQRKSVALRRGARI